MSHTDTSHIESKVVKTRKPYMSALIFFVCVLMLTGAIEIFSHMLGKDIQHIQQRITTNTQNVAKLKSQSSLLQVSHLLQINKTVLEKLSTQSDIVAYMSHLQEIEQKYRLSISGFDYTGETLAVGVVSYSTQDARLAYENIVSFLRDYPNDPNALFEIDYIPAFSGHDTLKFSLGFKVK